MNKQIGLLLVSALAMGTFAYVAQADVAGGKDKDTCEMMYGCAEAESQGNTVGQFVGRNC